MSAQSGEIQALLALLRKGQDKKRGGMRWRAADLIVSLCAEIFNVKKQYVDLEERASRDAREAAKLIGERERRIEQLETAYRGAERQVETMNGALGTSDDLGAG